MANTLSRMVVVGRSSEQPLPHDRQEANVAGALSAAAELARSTGLNRICIVANTKANLDANTIEPVIGPHLLGQLSSGQTILLSHDLALRFTTRGMRTPWPGHEIVIALWPTLALLEEIARTESIPHIVLVAWLEEEIEFAARANPEFSIVNPHPDWIEGGKHCTD